MQNVGVLNIRTIFLKLFIGSISTIYKLKIEKRQSKSERYYDGA